MRARSGEGLVADAAPLAPWLASLEAQLAKGWQAHAAACASADREARPRPGALPAAPPLEALARLRGHRQRQDAPAIEGAVAEQLWRLGAMAYIENDPAVVTARTRRDPRVLALRAARVRALGFPQPSAFYDRFHGVASADRRLTQAAQPAPFRAGVVQAEAGVAKGTATSPALATATPLGWAQRLMAAHDLRWPAAVISRGLVAATHLPHAPHQVEMVLPAWAWEATQTVSALRVVLHECGHAIAAEAVAPGTRWVLAQPGTRWWSETIAETFAALVDHDFDSARRRDTRRAWTQWQALRARFEAETLDLAIESEAALRAHWQGLVRAEQPAGASPCPLDEAWFFEDPGMQRTYEVAARCGRSLLAVMLAEPAVFHARMVAGFEDLGAP